MLLSIAPLVPPAAPAVGEPAFGPFGEPAILLGMPFFVGLVEVDRVGGGPASTAARISSGFSRRLAIGRAGGLVQTTKPWDGRKLVAVGL